MTNIQLYPELEKINNSIFKLCGFELSNLIHEAESQEYHACKFQLNGINITFRKAKITPKKVGQFVSLWKRSEIGITEPFNILDDFEFYIIAKQTDHNMGFFIFSKAILHQYKILSDKNNEGKRGFRVYSPWVMTTNNQAQKSQIWQTKYFLDISNDKTIDIKKATILLNLEK